jgi:hypothetical protein
MPGLSRRASAQYFETRSHIPVGTPRPRSLACTRIDHGPGKATHFVTLDQARQDSLRCGLRQRFHLRIGHNRPVIGDISNDINLYLRPPSGAEPLRINFMNYGAIIFP